MEPDRYAAQVRVPQVGRAGQARLAAARAVVVGVGATGCGIADCLVRAGVGTVVLLDRDLPELSNLQRQSLYDEEDVARGLPKAEAARRRLAQVNRQVVVEAVVADLGPGNALGLLRGADLVMDGTDNFVTRFLINDACAALGIPWVYAGVVGSTVHGFPVVPGAGPCFRCYLDRLPPPGSTETCDTAGVLGPAVLVASGLAAAEGLKLLLGRHDQLARGLFIVEVWSREARRIGFAADPACPTCAGRYEFLEASGQGEAELCGRDAVLVRPALPMSVDLPALAARLSTAGELLQQNAFLLRFRPPGGEELILTVFRDGRAIVHGTTDAAAARSAYARWLGA